MMTSKNTALVVAGLVFFLVAIAHVLRIVYKVEITVDGHAISDVASIAGLVIAIVLSIWMFMARRNP